MTIELIPQALSLYRDNIVVGVNKSIHSCYWSMSMGYVCEIDRSGVVFIEGMTIKRQAPSIF